MLFDDLTKYIPQLEHGDAFAVVVKEETKPGVTVIPTVEYTLLAKDIIKAFYNITESCEKYSAKVLLEFYDNSPFAETAFSKVDIDQLDLKSIMSLIAAVLHSEHWDNGTLHSFYVSGQLIKCLKRLDQLKEIDG